MVDYKRNVLTNREEYTEISHFNFHLYSARLTLREEVTRLFSFSSIARAGPSFKETGACYAGRHKMVDFIISFT